MRSILGFLLVLTTAKSAAADPTIIANAPYVNVPVASVVVRVEYPVMGRALMVAVPITSASGSKSAKINTTFRWSGESTQQTGTDLRVVAAPLIANPDWGSIDDLVVHANLDGSTLTFTLAADDSLVAIDKIADLPLPEKWKQVRRHLLLAVSAFGEAVDESGVFDAHVYQLLTEEPLPADDELDRVIAKVRAGGLLPVTAPTVVPLTPETNAFQRSMWVLLGRLEGYQAKNLQSVDIEETEDGGIVVDIVRKKGGACVLATCRETFTITTKDTPRMRYMIHAGRRYDNYVRVLGPKRADE